MKLLPCYIDILGSPYEIREESPKTFAGLKDCDGFCDPSTNLIVISSEVRDDQGRENFGKYQRQVLRHEIVHAFLFESGLHACIHYPEDNHDEQMVDWIATQFPKLYKAYEELGILE